jgi:hypothetical protein
MALTHLRLGTSLRATGAMFNVDEKSVRNWRDELHRVLLAHGITLPGWMSRIASLADLAEYLRDPGDTRRPVVLIDGVEVPRNRPGASWDEQKTAYSGKSRRHVVKGTVVTVDHGNPVWFEANPNGEGRTHDITMLRTQTALLAVLATAWLVLADRGYQGLHDDIDPDRVATPVYRRRTKAQPEPHLTPEESLWNRDQAGLRIRVEHTIGAMKNWKAMRHHRRHPDHFDTVGRSIATLISILRPQPADID